MKFKIRFADQIVGILIIAAFVVLIFVIFMLGSHQRWFAKDHQYRTYFDTATGLSPNMAVQYKGFTIGSVKSFQLTEDDEVEVLFSIHSEYGGRVRQGSLVDLEVSPIGLGNHFFFYPGLGEDPLEENAHIPSLNSPQGQTLIQLGLAKVPPKTDSIAKLIAQVGVIMDSLNGVLVEVKDAFAGTEATALGRTITNVTDLTGNMNQTLEPVLADVKKISSDLGILADKLVEPDGLVSTVLDTEGAVYTNLESSLKSISGTLRNLEKTTGYLPAEMPQIAGLIMELRVTLGTVEDVLTALLNNPLLRKGVPPRVQTESNGVSPRGIAF
ncbi:MAG: MlaD family protein [Spirochaetaceae bacterium]|jgi:phospholipid/cholesterol/gamma-HCH transport system substrate-binding protein|nr:MlaD family protein [Spirochaetaceae bacterium]